MNNFGARTDLFRLDPARQLTREKRRLKDNVEERMNSPLLYYITRLGIKSCYLPPAFTAAPMMAISSGVGSIVVQWGDGSVSHLAVGQNRRVHVYHRRGRFRVRVIVADRAGNTTRQGQQIGIS